MSSLFPILPAAGLLILLVFAVAAGSAAFGAEENAETCAHVLAPKRARKISGQGDAYRELREYLQRAVRTEIAEFRAGSRTTFTTTEKLLSDARLAYPTWNSVQVGMARRYIRDGISKEDSQLRNNALIGTSRIAAGITRRRSSESVREYLVSVAENEVIVHRMGAPVHLSNIPALFLMARRRFPNAQFSENYIHAWLRREMDDDLFRERVALISRQAAARAAATRDGSFYSDDVRSWVEREFLAVLERVSSGSLEPLLTLSDMGARAKNEFALPRPLSRSTVHKIFLQLDDVPANEYLRRLRLQTSARVSETHRDYDREMREVVLAGVHEELSATSARAPTVTTPPEWSAYLQMEFPEQPVYRCSIVRGWIVEGLSPSELARFDRGVQKTKATAERSPRLRTARDAPVCPTE